jgi:sugar phosphate isomerase/epimerase
MTSDGDKGVGWVRGPKDGIGLQLIIFGGEEEAHLTQVAAVSRRCGYDYLEMTLNGLKVPFEDLQVYMQAPPLPIKSIHVSYQNIQNDSDVDSVIRRLSCLGATYLICSGQEAESGDSLISSIRTAKRFNEVGKKCREAGFSFLVHAFNWAFTPRGGYVPLDELLQRTDPSLVGFNIDLFWAAAANCDLVELIRRVHKRCNYFHIKDGFADDPTVLGIRPLGAGKLPIEPCLKAISDLPGDYYIVVEQDVPGTSIEEDLRASRRFLGKIGL